MADLNINSSNEAGAAETSLSLLSELEQASSISQRTLSGRLGVALGLTNALLKRAVHKGLIKVQQVPAKRFAYYLTPKGFTEKSRLVAEYLSISLNFFRRARTEYDEIISHCERAGWKRVVLIGAGELTEIALLSSLDSEVNLAAVVDPGRNTNTFCGLPVLPSLSDVGEVDAVIITDATTPQQTYDALVKKFSPDKIFLPQILHVSRTKPELPPEHLEGEAT